MVQPAPKVTVAQTRKRDQSGRGGRPHSDAKYALNVPPSYGYRPVNHATQQLNQRQNPRQQTFYAAFLYANLDGEWLRSEVKVFDQSLGGVRVRTLRPIKTDEVYLQLDPTNPCLARCTIRRKQAVARNCWEYGFELKELAEMQNVLPPNLIARYRSQNQQSAREEIVAASEQTAAEQIDGLLTDTLGVSLSLIHI